MALDETTPVSVEYDLETITQKETQTNVTAGSTTSSPVDLVTVMDMSQLTTSVPQTVPVGTTVKFEDIQIASLASNQSISSILPPVIPTIEEEFILNPIITTTTTTTTMPSTSVASESPNLVSNSSSGESHQKVTFEPEVVKSSTPLLTVVSEQSSSTVSVSVPTTTKLTEKVTVAVEASSENSETENKIVVSSTTETLNPSVSTTTETSPEVELNRTSLTPVAAQNITEMPPSSLTTTMKLTETTSRLPLIATSVIGANQSKVITTSTTVRPTVQESSKPIPLNPTVEPVVTVNNIKDITATTEATITKLSSVWTSTTTKAPGSVATTKRPLSPSEVLPLSK